MMYLKMLQLREKQLTFATVSMQIMEREGKVTTCLTIGFRVLPQYGNDLRLQYNRQLMLIAKSNLLQFLLSQIMGKEVKITKQDPDLWKDILDTNYSLS